MKPYLLVAATFAAIGLAARGETLAEAGSRTATPPATGTPAAAQQPRDTTTGATTYAPPPETPAVGTQRGAQQAPGSTQRAAPPKGEQKGAEKEAR